MNSINFTSGVTVSATSFSSSPIVQGGDTINITINISDYTYQQHVVNSSACQAVNFTGLILVPVFLQLISLDKYSKIESNETNNCTQALDVSQSNDMIYLSSVNITWNSQFSYSYKVLSDVYPNSSVKVIGNFSTISQYSLLTLAEYTTPSLDNFILTLKDSSVRQTPDYQLVNHEYANIGGSIILPSITTSILHAIIKLPYFSSGVYLEFATGAATRVTSKSGVTLRGSSLYLTSQSGYSSVGVFQFGRTTSSIRGGSINLNIRVALVVSQPYIPLASGDVTFELEYYNDIGQVKIFGPISLQFNLSQPYLDITFSTIKSKPLLQAYDEVIFECAITNPDYASESVSRPTLTNTVFPSQVHYTSSTVFCDQQNNCTEIYPSQSLQISPGSKLKITFKTDILPSAVISSTMGVYLTVEYRRPSWTAAISKIVELDYHKIRSVNFTGGSQISQSSLSSFNDMTVIVPGENITFGFNVTLPLATMKNFAILVESDGAELIDGQVTAGSSIQNGSGPLHPSAMITTSSSVAYIPVSISSPVLYSLFPLLVNSDKKFSTSNSTISFQVNAQALNGIALASKEFVTFETRAFHDRTTIKSLNIKLKIIKPELQVSTSVSPIVKVNPLQDVFFTVVLSHTVQSTSDAFRVLLETALPYDLLTPEVSSIQPSGKISVVAGDKAPSGSPRYNDTRTKVLVFVTNEFNLNTSITITFKARTSSTLPTSLFVKLPIYLTYTALPLSHAPVTGQLYTYNLDSVSFLSFRPDPYLQINYTSTPKVVDAGDFVQYKAIITNTGVNNDKHSAYELNLIVDFKHMIMKNLTFECSRGVKSNASGKAMLNVGTLPYKDQFYCDMSGIVAADVAPEQDISPTIHYTFYSTPPSRPVGTVSYNLTSQASTLVSSIVANVTSSNNAERLLAGQDLSFTLKLFVPECVTKLVLLVELPVVSIDGTRFERQRRSVINPLSRSRAQRSASNTIHVLEALINQTTITPDVNSTLNITNPSPNITFTRQSSLEIDFGYVQNAPSPLRLYQGLTMVLRVRSASLPLILSGRNLVVISNVVFTGGQSTITSGFSIVGPICKPLLQITKSVQIFDQERDSPVFQYNVTVTHKHGSPCDAYDITAVDDTKNVDVDRLSVVPKSDVVVTYPSLNVYVLTYSVPVLKVGETATMLYRASFIIKEKDKKSFNIPARLSWKSIQLNSPVYSLISNLTACVSRRESSKYKEEEITGFFALGIVLGLLIGLAAACIIIVLIIKCCDTGKIASCYLRFTNKDSMTVLTGGSQYVFKGEPDNKLITKHKEVSIVKTDESIIPILSLNNAAQTERELDSLDVQATVNLDVELESQRQNMFMHGLSLLVKKLRVKREISSSQERQFVSRLKAEFGTIGYKMSAEFKRRSVDITETRKKKTKILMKEQAKRESKERQEAENKIKGLVDARERKEILEILRQRHAKEEQDIKKRAKLDLDVEMEKLRKEISIGRRFGVKECQNRLLQDLIKEGRINEERANELVREHLAIMAAIDKATDEERARRLVALEMRLAERRALALQKLDDDKHNQEVIDRLSDRQDESLDVLIGSSKVSEADVAAYRIQYKKDLDGLNKKLAKERQQQEKKFHMKLTALKQKRVEDMSQQHAEERRKSDEEQDDKIEQVEIDCIDSINERQRMLERQRREIEDIEREADHEAADEVQKLHDRQARVLQLQAKTSVQKICRDMTSKGLDESLKNSIIDKYTSELARQQEAKEEKRQRDSQLLEKRLCKLRKALEKKAVEEVSEQEEIRKKEEEIINELIVSQVVMSEEERDKILEEHERNLVELESSLTLNKLRQRQKLEERLAEKRKQKMQELQKLQQEEEQVKDYSDKILNEAEDIEMLKKHEREKINLLKEEEDNRLDELSEQVREDMMNERSRKLQEHQENISARIAKLQIEKAKQISQMRYQQQVLNQLQTNLVDELESAGALDDPEAIEIVEKYKRDAKKVEDKLRKQKIKQEEDLKERLEEKLKERRKTIIAENKARDTKLTEENRNVPALVRFRKAAVKARQEEQLNELKIRMEKEKEQSLNQLRVNHDLQRMRVTEEKNIQFIAMLVNKGQLKLEEVESTLKFLFPTKPPEYIDSLLLKIYGTGKASLSSTGPKNTSLLLNSVGEMSKLEERVRRTSLRRPLQAIKVLQSEKDKRKRRNKSKRLENSEDDLPPVIVRQAAKPPTKLRPLNFGQRSTPSTDGTDSMSSARPLLKPITPRPKSPEKDTQDDRKLLDEMFGDSPEPDSPVIVKKRKKKKLGIYRDLPS